MGNPAWMICKYAMYDHVATYFLSKRFYYLSKRFYFLSKCFYIFRHLCYFSEITFFIALWFLSQRFIIALLSYFTALLCYVIALLFCFIALLFCFIALLFFGKALLFNFSKCKQALIFYSSKYETVSKFVFQNINQLLLYFLCKHTIS